MCAFSLNHAPLIAQRPSQDLNLWLLRCLQIALSRQPGLLQALTRIAPGLQLTPQPCRPKVLRTIIFPPYLQVFQDSLLLNSLFQLYEFLKNCLNPKFRELNIAVCNFYQAAGWLSDLSSNRKPNSMNLENGKKQSVWTPDSVKASSTLL